MYMHIYTHTHAHALSSPPATHRMIKEGRLYRLATCRACGGNGFSGGGGGSHARTCTACSNGRALDKMVHVRLWSLQRDMTPSYIPYVT